MLIDWLKMGFLGATSGFVVSGGVFTALLAVGLVPRFAGKTHTANKILTYETAVVSGCIIGGLFSIFPAPEVLATYIYSMKFFASRIWEIIADTFMSLSGFLGGCFVGCVALAIAEMLDSIPIFARRIRFREGLGIVVIVVAVGKTLGSLVYFGMRIYEIMG